MINPKSIILFENFIYKSNISDSEIIDDSVITDIPHEFIVKKNKLYILSILDHFSKFSANFIIKNKDKITVLNKIKKYIKKYGAPDKILTDNGGEFINNEFKKFCKK